MDKLAKAIDSEIDRIQKFYPNKEALLLPVLHAAQRAEGWLSEETMGVVAERLELPKPKVRQVASFYTMFLKKPVGKCHLQVCNNIACWLRGSEKLIHHIEHKLGIQLGETTPDGIFTLSEVECLGSCGTAPVAQVNDDYHENLSVSSVDELIKEWRQ
jgi:NADH-quinone oxidoreductase E subunit